MRPRLRAAGIVIALAACAASVWAQAPSSQPERTPRARPSAGPGFPSAFRAPSAWMMPTALPSGLPSAWPAAPKRGGRSLAELAEAARLGTANPEELKKKLNQLAATRKTRRAESVAELGYRFNDATLDDPAFREELRVHARRMALLNRAELIAALELTEPKRTQTLERVRKLKAKEQQRHAARAEKLRKPGATPGAGPSSVAPRASAP